MKGRKEDRGGTEREDGGGTDREDRGGKEKEKERKKIGFVGGDFSYRSK